MLVFCIILIRCDVWEIILVFGLFQFQTELRKILVSLIEVAQKLLALNPDAVELFKKANGKLFNSVGGLFSVSFSAIF